MKLKKLQHKSTGVWFWMQARLCFGKPSFSADQGNTWHLSKTMAYRAAVKSNTLAVCEVAK